MFTIKIQRPVTEGSAWEELGGKAVNSSLDARQVLRRWVGEPDMISDYEGSYGDKINCDKLGDERLPIKTFFSKAQQKDCLSNPTPELPHMFDFRKLEMSV